LQFALSPHIGLGAVTNVDIDAAVCRAANNGPWMCIFALDIYDWKDLGRTSHQPRCPTA
jgi:hypothetical protein